MKKLIVLVFFILNVLRSSSQITNPSESTIWIQGSTNVKIDWKTQNLGGTVNISLYQGETKVYTIASSTANAGSFNWNSVPVSLSSASNYLVRIQFSANGAVNYSSYFSIKPKASSKPTIIIHPVSDIGSTSAYFNVSINPNNSYTTIFFEYGTTESLGKQWGNSSLNASLSSQNIKCYISGLASGQTYYYRLTASNGAGSTSSSIFSFQTKPPTVPNIPQLISPSNSANRSVGSEISFNWNPVSGASDYWLEVTKDGTIVWNTSVGNITTKAFSATFLGNAGTFSWRVRAYNNVGWGDFTNPWIVKYIDKSSLLAWYPFNGNANDESGNGNNGTVVGAKLTTDRFGKPNSAFLFNGTASNYILVPKSSSLEPQNALTISFWSKRSGAGQHGETIIRKASNCTAGYIIFATAFYINGPNCCSGESSSLSYISNNYRWDFYTFTYDISSGIKCFRNGNLIANNPPLNKVMTHTGDLFIGGATVHSLDGGFYGVLDDIRIYNRALSETEITTLFKEGNFTDTDTPNLLTDIDGNSYRTVSIGSQQWMAENLKTTKFSDGTPIPLVTNNYSWSSLSTPGYCWYQNNDIYKTSYGALYNWFAVSNSKNICPSGWHVPNDDEYNELEASVGLSKEDQLKTNWRGTHAENLKPSGSTGFNVQYGGVRTSAGYNFHSLGSYGYYWLTSANNEAWFRILGINEAGVQRGISDKTGGFSVRCVKDNTGIKIPSVNTSKVTIFTEKTATFSGEILSDGGSPILEKGFCWNTEPNPSISNNKIICQTNSNFLTSTVSSLVSGQKYYIKSYAINGKGIAYGNEESFTTANEDLSFWNDPAHQKGGIAVKVIETGGSKLVKYVGYKGRVGVSENVITKKFKINDTGFYFINDFSLFVKRSDELDTIFLFNAKEERIGHIIFKYIPIDEKEFTKHIVLLLHTSPEECIDEKGLIHFPYSESNPNYIPDVKSKWDYFIKGEYPVTMLITPDYKVGSNWKGNQYPLDTSKMPVIFVHGVDGKYTRKDNNLNSLETSYWWMQVKKMNEFTSMSAWQVYYPYDSPIDFIGKWLLKDITYIRSIYNKQLKLVAHSMGGLVTMEMITTLGNEAPKYVDKVFLCTPPLHGSLSANKQYKTILGYRTGKDREAPAYRDLSFGSDFISNLHKKNWPDLNQNGILYDDYFVLLGLTDNNFTIPNTSIDLDVLHEEALGQSDGVVALSSASLLDHKISFAGFYGNHDDGAGRWSNLPLTKEDSFISNLAYGFFKSNTDYSENDLKSIDKNIILAFNHNDEEKINQVPSDVKLNQGIITIRFKNANIEQWSRDIFSDKLDFALTIDKERKNIYLNPIFQEQTYITDNEFILTTANLVAYSFPILQTPMRLVNEYKTLFNAIIIGYFNKNKETSLENVSYFFTKQAGFENCVTDLNEDKYNILLKYPLISPFRLGTVDIKHKQTNEFIFDVKEIINPYSEINNLISTIFGKDSQSLKSLKLASSFKKDTFINIDNQTSSLMIQLICPEAYKSGKKVEFKVFYPNGNLLDTTTNKLFIDSIFGCSFYKINNPLPGKWRIHLSSAESSLDEYCIRSFVSSNLTALNAFKEGMYPMKTEIILNPYLKAIFPSLIDSCDLKLKIILPDSSSRSFDLSSKGELMDSALVYKFPFYLENKGVYNFEYKFEGKYNGFKFSRVLYQSLISYDPKPTMKVPDLNLSPVEQIKEIKLINRIACNNCNPDSTKFAFQVIASNVNPVAINAVIDTTGTWQFYYNPVDTGYIRYEVEGVLDGYVIKDTINTFLKAPNLKASNIKFELSAPKINVNFELKNEGNFGVNSYSLEYFLSKDNALDSTDRKIKTANFNNLDAKSQLAVKDTLVIPDSLKNSKFLIGKIDPLNHIEEFNESDNVFSIAALNSSVNLLLSDNINIYPNPFNDEIFVKVDRDYSDVKIQITDIIGKELMSKRYGQIHKGNLIAISDVKKLKKGSYLIKVICKDGYITKKIIKD